MTTESAATAGGLVVDHMHATQIMKELQGMLLRGHPTNTPTLRHIRTRIGHDHTHILLSNQVGEFFASKGYPHIYNTMVQNNIAGPKTISIPTEGATLWRPIDVTTIQQQPGTTVHIGTQLAYMTVQNDQALSDHWGLTAYYEFHANKNQTQQQLQQKRTSTIHIDTKGHLGALLMANWTNLGPTHG